jgi:hypothetical protein
MQKKPIVRFRKWLLEAAFGLTLSVLLSASVLLDPSFANAQYSSSSSSSSSSLYRSSSSSRSNSSSSSSRSYTSSSSSRWGCNPPDCGECAVCTAIGCEEYEVGPCVGCKDGQVKCPDGRCVSADPIRDDPMGTPINCNCKQDCGDPCTNQCADIEPGPGTVWACRKRSHMKKCSTGECVPVMSECCPVNCGTCQRCSGGVCKDIGSPDCPPPADCEGPALKPCGDKCIGVWDTCRSSGSSIGSGF